MTDYGSDPAGVGKFKMVPSGDIVDWVEMSRRLATNTDPLPEGACGLSWSEIEKMQKGKLKR